MRPFTHQDALPANDTQEVLSKTGQHLAHGKRLLTREAAALERLSNELSPSFERSVDLVLACPGRVFVSGEESIRTLGTRAARILNRAGIPSVWINASDARDSCPALTRKRDLFLLISASAHSESLLRLLSGTTDRKVSAICLSLLPSSVLARRCTEFLDCGGRPPETSPLGNGPSENLLHALTLALVETVATAKQVKIASFETPLDAGLQQRLVLKAGDLMRSKEELASLHPEATWDEILRRIQKSDLGAICITDHGDQIVGLISARELLAVTALGSTAQSIARDLMSQNPPTVDVHTAIGDAMNVMKQEKLDCLPVTSEDGRFVGVLSLRDLLL